MGGTVVSMHRLEAVEQAERAHIAAVVCMLRLACLHHFMYHVCSQVESILSFSYILLDYWSVTYEMCAVYGCAMQILLLLRR